jgi:capsid portal protein
MVVLVSGGRLAATAKAELEQLMTDQVKGRRNIHRTIVLEAESGPGSGISGALSQQVRIEFKPLTEALLKDQLWSGYDVANRNKVGQSFRIPPILRGDTVDFNRATADAALRYSDEQVFQPERDDWDWEINRTLVSALGVTMWRFRSLPPRSDDPASTLDVLARLTDTVLSPDESRRIAARAFDVELPKYGTPWSRTPAKFAIAGFSPDLVESEEGMGASDVATEATGATVSPGASAGEPPIKLEPPVRMRVSQDQWRRIFQGDVEPGPGPETTGATSIPPLAEPPHV